MSFRPVVAALMAATKDTRMEHALLEEDRQGELAAVTLTLVGALGPVMLRLASNGTWREIEGRPEAN